MKSIDSIVIIVLHKENKIKGLMLGADFEKSQRAGESKCAGSFLNELFQVQSGTSGANWLSSGKLRASYRMVGSDLGLNVQQCCLCPVIRSTEIDSSVQSANIWSLRGDYGRRMADYQTCNAVLSPKSFKLFLTKHVNSC